MTNDLQPAVSMLLKKLDDQLKQAALTKKGINMLLELSGQAPMFPDEVDANLNVTVIRADTFYGKQLATAAAEYLETQKHACPATEILEALKRGGFDFGAIGWKKKDELRMLALSLAKNTAKFHKLKNGSIGLRSWYDEEFLKKVARQKTAATLSEEESEDESSEDESS
jgi:hypothetical protein